MLKNPIRAVRIPDEMTILHMGRPRLSALVAVLLRFPRMLKPKTIIAVPRKTKPDSGLSIGQLRAKYLRKRFTSETTRKMPIELVMKWETPSKKKN